MASNPPQDGLKLARREDFRLGAATIRPALRTVVGPSGSAAVEPRVMQVLVVLTDACSAVLSRDELMHRCWGGAIVSDNAITRTIAEIRRVAQQTGAGFGIETIPRIGYRLTVDAQAGAEPQETAAATAPGVSSGPPPPTRPASRRWWLGAGLAVAGSAVLGGWVQSGRRADSRYAALLGHARQLLREDTFDSYAQAVAELRAAVELRPGDATAWGLLAVAEFNASSTATESDRAAQQARRLNPREPNALAVLALLGRNGEDWYETERRLREVLRIDAYNTTALIWLGFQLQAAGYSQEAYELREIARARDPSSPTFQQLRALGLWVQGKDNDAVNVITDARTHWPGHPFTWYAALWINAFTGRVKEARNVLDNPYAPDALSPPETAAWQAALAALGAGATGPLVAAARDAWLAAADQVSRASISNQGILVLSRLGQLDAAYELVDGLLLRSGQKVPALAAEPQRTPANDPAWRETAWLFTPATRPLRENRRFAPLCEAIGLTRYWKRRGRRPDECEAGLAPGYCANAVDA